MTDQKILSIVAIIQTGDVPVDVYHARCQTCGWESKHYNTQMWAQRAAERHTSNAHRSPPAAASKVAADIDNIFREKDGRLISIDEEASGGA